MIVPEFWAEGRVQHREKRKQVTVRRFGWSDRNQEEAQEMADARAREALQRILTGDSKAQRMEPKVPYNGADGVPIREEIVSRHGNCVITRNSYGARCLNTPNVLFVDVDFDDRQTATLRGCGVQFLLTLALIGAAFALGWHSEGAGNVVGILIGAFFAGSALMWLGRKIRLLLGGGAETIALRRIRRFVETHRDWSVRVYRTPAGLRMMAVHRTFDPEDAEVQDSFAQLHADKYYVNMCRHQRCFRARLTAKPWRLGIARHIISGRVAWPPKPDRLPARRGWIEHYEQAASGHAACSWITDLGSGIVASEVRPVMELHDRESRALTGLPIA
jgi:hypothetical protein